MWLFGTRSRYRGPWFWLGMFYGLLCSLALGLVAYLWVLSRPEGQRPLLTPHPFTEQRINEISTNPILIVVGIGVFVIAFWIGQAMTGIYGRRMSLRDFTIGSPTAKFVTRTRSFSNADDMHEFQRLQILGGCGAGTMLALLAWCGMVLYYDPSLIPKADPKEPAVKVFMPNPKVTPPPIKPVPGIPKE